MQEMKKTIHGGLMAGLLVLGAMLQPARLMAQAPTATIHGHVNNAAGQPVVKGDVKLSTDRTSEAKNRKYQYTFPIDASGDYKGADIAPGNYVAFVMQDDKSLDFLDNQDLKAGDDKTVNFDMSRPEYIEKMTPEERKTLEEFKKKNADVVAGNAKIANLNATLVQARADTKAGNFDASITAMQQATTQKPDEAILWVALGDAQLGKATPPRRQPSLPVSRVTRPCRPPMLTRPPPTRRLWMRTLPPRNRMRTRLPPPITRWDRLMASRAT